MNGIIRVFTLASAFAFAAVAQQPQVKLVEITDMAGDKGYELLDNEGFNALRTQIVEETKLFPQALVECKKQWAADKELKGAFPSSQVKVRKMKVVQQGTEEAMSRRKEKLEDRVAAAKAKDIEREEQKLKSFRGRNKQQMQDKYLEDQEAIRQRKSRGVQMVSTWMKEKLERDIPFYGNDFMAFGAADTKKEVKKDAKADAKKEAKKPDAADAAKK